MSYLNNAGEQSLSHTIQRKDAMVDTLPTPVMKTLVGSRFWETHTEESDWDWRLVVRTPQRERWLMDVNHVRHTTLKDGNGDYAKYEFDHFIRLIALKGNPSAIEVAFGGVQFIRKDLETVNWMDLIDLHNVARAVIGLSLGMLKQSGRRSDRIGKSLASALIAQHLFSSLVYCKSAQPMTDEYADWLIRLKREPNQHDINTAEHAIQRGIDLAEEILAQKVRPANLEYAKDLCEMVYSTDSPLVSIESGSEVITDK